jgi:hypothetical protein
MLRVFREDDINKKTRQIKKGTFIPRTTGKDDDGLSVTQPLSDSRAQLAERLQRRQPEKDYFCTLSAGSIREVEVEAINLQVCPARTASDPFHALIKNIPTDSASLAIRTRFAELLAKAATEYVPLP